MREEKNDFEVRLNSDLSQFARHVHSYIREYISLADQKAAFIFTAGTGLLAYLNQTGVTKTWQTLTPITNPTDILVPIALVSLGIGILLSVLVVVPNLKAGKGRKGYIFWGSIVKYKSSDGYLEAICSGNGSDFNQALLEHCYALAGVCTRKYKYLRYSIYSCAIGIFSTVFLLVFTG